MNKIFVSIASYRDPEIISTLESLITQADNPDNLVMVVFEQNGLNDISTINLYPQVKTICANYLEAKGPCWARYIIQQEYNNEEYYMQIDSHTRVIKHWDSKLKHMLTLLPEPAVLTQYPPSYTFNSTKISKVVRTGLYIKGFGPKDGFTRIQSDRAIEKTHYPYTSKAWAACFSFSKGTIVHDAPYDKYCDYLFFGEELDITLRLFTRGYYFYSPNESIVFTLFKRNYRRTFWQDIIGIKETAKKSRERVWNKIIYKIDMGTNRTIEQYMKFADIESITNNKMKKCAKTFKRKCIVKLYR